MVSNTPHTLVVGDGVIGLSIALHLAARRVPVTLLCPQFNGAASPASAGMLAPSVERTQGPAQTFSDAARDAWPRLEALAQSLGGQPFEVRRDGILRVARTREEADRVRASIRAGDRWLSVREARELAPALGEIEGGALYAGDGVVDAPAALASLRAATRAAGVAVVPSALASIELGGKRASGRLDDGRQLEVDAIVLAAGAWTNTIRGIPRPLPVRPLRGALFAVTGLELRVPVYDAEGHAYVLPRGAVAVVGATSDEAGFDAVPANADVDRLVAAASACFPALRSLPRTAHWVGLRPMTPDGLALIGPDPEHPNLYYACGHGRNGFLQAALTAEVISALILGDHHHYDISPFDPERFAMP
jgi:glycine oxidase